MTTDKMTLAVNHAVSEARVRAAREGLIGGHGGNDNKRACAWSEYGFPDHLTFSSFYGMYRRGGIAHGAIEKLIGTCWKTDPWIIQGDEQDKAKTEAPWERKLKPLLKGGRLWRAFKEADRRRLVGRFSALMIQLKDDKGWGEKVERSAEIAKLIPVWQSSLTVKAIDDRPESQTYGEVLMWTYKEAGVNGSGGREIDLHPDRLFILGDAGPDAIGFLEPAFNALISLEKVEGGSGESFLKNAARQLGINFDKDIDLNSIAALYGVPVADLHERFNDAARDINRGNDALLITQGASTSPLVSTVADPVPTYEVNLRTVSAALDIASRILTGSQSGERASSEDQKYFNARCQSRRGELAVEIHAFIEHLIRIKVVAPQAEFTVLWDDLTEASQIDRLSNVKLMGEANMAALATGELVFTVDEMREAAGLDPHSKAVMGEIDDEDVEDGPISNPA